MDTDKLSNPLFTLTIGEYIDLTRNLVNEILEKSSSRQNYSLPDEILSTDEAADFLKMTKSTLYKLTCTRQIPHFKKHKRILFKREDLVNYISDARIKTSKEIDIEALRYVTLKPFKKR